MKLETKYHLTLWMLFFATLYAGVLSLRLDHKTAEINYYKAYSRHIEGMGLAHWNNWYALNQNKFNKPKTTEEIIDYVFEGKAELAKNIAKCESGLNPRAKNTESSARGLFQVLAYTHDINEKWLYDPMINALVAKKLMDASGTNPWVSSLPCWTY